MQKHIKFAFTVLTSTKKTVQLYPHPIEDFNFNPIILYGHEKNAVCICVCACVCVLNWIELWDTLLVLQNTVCIYLYMCVCMCIHVWKKKGYVVEGILQTNHRNMYFKNTA